MAVVGGWDGALSLAEAEVEPIRCGRNVYTRTTSASTAGMMTSPSRLPLGSGGGRSQQVGVRGIAATASPAAR